MSVPSLSVDFSSSSSLSLSLSVCVCVALSHKISFMLGRELSKRGFQRESSYFLTTAAAPWNKQVPRVVARAGCILEILRKFSIFAFFGLMFVVAVCISVYCTAGG